MASYNYQFYQTYKIFSDYLSNYSHPVNYATWRSADPDDQVAILYVRFFPEILQAWWVAVASRPNVTYVTQEDGVETVLQYLSKLPSRLMQNPEQYTARYIHRVCYNCLGCLYRPQTAQWWGDLGSDEVTIDDMVLSLWDIIPLDTDDYETQQTKEAIWATIRHLGPKAEKVVNHLLNPEDRLSLLPKKTKVYKMDRLATVEVTAEEYPMILSELKRQLAPLYAELFA